MCTVELGLEDGGIEGCGAFRIAEEQHHYIVTQVPLPLHLPHPSVPKAHTHTHTTQRQCGHGNQSIGTCCGSLGWKGIMGAT